MEHLVMDTVVIGSITILYVLLRLRGGALGWLFDGWRLDALLWILKALETATDTTRWSR
jgi:hypothetical protein